MIFFIIRAVKKQKQEEQELSPLKKKCMLLTTIPAQAFHTVK